MFRTKQNTVLTLTGFIFMLFLAGSAWSADTSEDVSDRFDFLHEFHGHTCAGSLMGARLGLAAKEAIKELGSTGRLKAEYYNHSCPVDGVQVMAGTTYGNGAITVHDNGDHRLVLMDEQGGYTVEARLTELAMEKAKPTRQLSREARALPEGDSQRQKLEQEVAAVYEWFRTAPTDEVVTVKTISE